MKLEFSQQICEKSSNIKFHEIPSCGSRVVPCRRTDMAKLIAAFRRFAKAPHETINCDYVPQEHHKSLETTMVFEPSRATYCLAKVVFHSLLNGNCKIPLKTQVMTRHYYVALFVTFLRRDSQVTYMIWNTLHDCSLSSSPWSTFLSPPHSDHVSDHTVNISLRSFSVSRRAWTTFWPFSNNQYHSQNLFSRCLCTETNLRCFHCNYR
jgi:hypothetical protein